MDTPFQSAPTGSIARAESPRPDLLVFEIAGRITEPDIEWMAHGVEAAFERLGQVDMLLIMRRYEGSDWGAVFDADMARVQAKSLRHVRRYAVVGAPGWARTMIEAFDKVMPVDAATFDLEDEAAARSWIDRPPEA